MNISMGFLKPVIGTLKKYKMLLPSIVITVLAVLLFLMTVSTGKKLKDDMAKSAGKMRSVPRLEDVPSKDGQLQAKLAMDKLEKQATQLKEMAIQASQRDLVTYDYKFFPKPIDPSQQIYIEFGRQYRAAIEKLVQRINALDAPSDAEIKSKTGGGTRASRGAAGYGRNTAPAQDPRVDALCLTRAQEVSVYANPSAFAWYPFWESYVFSGQSQAIEHCWDSQTAFWIYEDIIDTIEKMNGTAGNVLSAPVKRLLGVRFSGPVTGGRSGATTAKGGDTPSYVLPGSSSVFLADSPTGRVCNDDIDVLHFAVSVLLDSRSVLAFMKELCSEKPHSFHPGFDPSQPAIQSRHNQISILQTDLAVVDKADAAHALYRYGKGAVMQLDLICEYQFYRKGYDSIKPEEIKERLGQLEKEGPQDTPGGMMPGMMPGM